MKLALGTVQFGMNYGLANSSGQVSLDNAEEILFKARSAGIDTLDTAIAYGDSEQVLGELDLNGFQVVTKLPEVPVVDEVHNWINEQFSGSLSRLKSSRVHALMLHRPTQLMSRIGQDIWDTLIAFKSDGMIEKIGVSIYSPDEINQIVDRFPIDLVQVPVNIFDRSFENSGWAEKTQQQNIEIHARSIFLQGLLLMPAAQRPKKFERWQELFHKWDQWLVAESMSPLQACLRYVESLNFVDKMIVGVDSLKQLEQILEAADGVSIEGPAFHATQEKLLINPSRWSEL